MAYIMENDLLPASQFAYRRRHSTEDALEVVLVVNRWLIAKYERKETGVVFVDMSKAFDSVKHKLLLEELSNMGVTGTANSWLASYLIDRYQRVVVGGSMSSYTQCSRGVPQGSVLGPLLFTLYIRDIHHCIPRPVVHQEFADDIVLKASGSRAVVCTYLSTAVTNLSTWLEDRGLKLNQTKTQVLLITPRGGQQNAEPLQIRCDGKLLTIVSQARYLGVIVDNELSWDGYVDHTIRQVRRSIGALWRSRQSLTVSSKNLFYHAMIMSRLTYGSNAIYPSLMARNMDALTRMTEAAIRAFFG